MVSASVPRVADDESLTVCVPVSPVSGIGVVVPESATVLVNESPLAVGSPSSVPPV